MREVAKRRTCWLALMNDYWLADAGTYRAVLPFVTTWHPFDAIYLISGEGGVDRLD